MKEHITPQDLKDLTSAQRETLRSMWLPEKNDLAVAFICTNVETDEYDDIEFVVGEVLIKGKMMHHHMILRRFRLVDEPEVDIEADDLEAGETGGAADSKIVDFPIRQAEKVSDRFADDDVLSEEDEELIPYIEPEQYFNVEDCLPLLSIGQMIGILRKTRVGQNGLELYIPPETNRVIDRRLFTLSDSEGEAFESEEMCDLLWDAVKTVI